MRGSHICNREPPFVRWKPAVPRDPAEDRWRAIQSVLVPPFPQRSHGLVPARRMCVAARLHPQGADVRVFSVLTSNTRYVSCRPTECLVPQPRFSGWGSQIRAGSGSFSCVRTDDGRVGSLASAAAGLASAIQPTLGDQAPSQLESDAAQKEAATGSQEIRPAHAPPATTTAAATAGAQRLRQPEGRFAGPPPDH